MAKLNLNIKSVGFVSGLIVFLTLLIFPVSSENINASNMAAIASLMAIWWMTEAIPIAATALIPIILFPILGVSSGKVTSLNYMNSTIFLFLGGFMIAVAMQKWGLHKRIALKVINKIGSSPSGMITGFMIAAFFLSMFISNTATTIMMLPIGLAIITKMELDHEVDTTKSFSIALMLGIAYAASVGGTATLVGTVPNLAFKSIFEATFSERGEISFTDWIVYGLPTALIMLVLIRILILKVFYKPNNDLKIESNIVENELRELGKMSFEEKTVLSILTTTALLWIFRSDINIGFFMIPGWSNLFPFSDYIDDGTVAMTTATLLYIIPSKNNIGSRHLSTDSFRKLPWDIIILFGGGFALASGFESTGLSQIVGKQFEGLAGMSPFLLTIFACLMLTFLTELTSNTATTYTMLPILASISVSIGIDPLLIMIPATMSASYAFMLPVATPPNAIVFGSDRLKIKDMMRIGIWINLLGVFIATIMYYLIGKNIW